MEALAAETAGRLALQGAGWAVAMLFLVGIVMLSKRNEALQAQLIALISATTTTAETGKAATTAHTAAIERLQAAQATTAQALQEQGHETANEIREARHAVQNHHAGVNAVVELLARQRGSA